MADPVSVVVPARNEAETIGKVVATLSGMADIDEIIVVDNGSDDATASVAARAGARVVTERRPGMGHAVKAGFAEASHDWVMKVDADLDKFDTRLFARMPAARAQGVGLVKGAWHDPDDDMPMTRLLVMPAIRQMFPGLAHLRAPNSGLYLFDKSLIAHSELSGDYAVDLDVMLRVHAAGAQVAEVDIGRIQHDSRDLQHYNAMAETIMAFFLVQNARRITQELVVLAHEAGQIVGNCLGTLASKSISGAPVTVYLAEAKDQAADVLRTALAPFPTVRILPMEQAADHQPRLEGGQICVIAPYPTAHQDNPLRAALRLAQAKGEDGQTDVLMMPLPGDRAVLGAFRPDTALDIGVGAAIKQAALARLHADDPGALQSLPSREMFQTFQSLPDALRFDMQPGDRRSEASNM